MLSIRITTALLGAPVVLLVIALGGIPFIVALSIVAAFASYELLSMLRRAGFAPLLVTAVALSAALPVAAAWPTVPGLQMLAIAVAIMASFVVWMASPQSQTPADWGLTLAVPVLCGGFLSLLVLLREGNVGLWWVLAVVVGTWTADIAAYGVGRTVGRTPLFPQISPKKTREGAVGALLVTPLVVLALVLVSPSLSLVAPLSSLVALLLGLVLAAAATVGDLAESLLKRHCGVKDSGVILPGHGGLLDRIDGLLFAGVAGYGMSLVVR